MFEYRLFWKFTRNKQELIVKTLKEFLIKNSILFEEMEKVKVVDWRSSELLLKQQHYQLESKIKNIKVSIEVNEESRIKRSHFWRAFLVIYIILIIIAIILILQYF